MINESELNSEKKYLKGVINVLQNQLKDLNNTIYDREKILHNASEYMHENYHDMDNEEEAVTKRMLEELQIDVEGLIDSKILKERQVLSPYFGRIDFKASDEDTVNPYYIGISHILSPKYPLPLVIDWRAPLSSMYYDFELGKAFYYAPMGKIQGKIFLKRQYKTLKNKLIYAFDSSLTIGDEILCQTLAQNADSKMKNIVATIQSEQNKIIRQNEDQNILVQGVAGSGKTSIALHRVAYLLYKNKIKASDILIISPSSLFSDYISNVLPELGEQNTPKITFDEIAKAEIQNLFQFEPKSQMLEDVLSGNPTRAKEITIKSSFDFFDKLQNYLHQNISPLFQPEDMKFDTLIIHKEELLKLYNENYKAKTPAIRIEWIADYIVDKLEVAKQAEQAIFNRVKRVLFGMFQNTNIIDIYSNFLREQNLTFQSAQVEKTTFVGYEEVAPLLFIKDYVLGTEPKKHFKHIIIDEMQDYSPISLFLLNKIYPANKTILGDISQTFEKKLQKTYLTKLSELLGNTKIINLNTTYRSTLQIAEYNQSIINLKNVKNFNRSGAKPHILKKTNNLSAKLNKIIETLTPKYQSIAIITPSIKFANEIFAYLDPKLNFSLIDEASGQAKEKKIVLPAIYSKGLEFDAVIFVNENLNSPALKQIATNIKYISCTRALHELYVIQ